LNDPTLNLDLKTFEKNIRIPKMPPLLLSACRLRIPYPKLNISENSKLSPIFKMIILFYINWILFGKNRYFEKKKRLGTPQ
jgi:hypothetical protein